MRLIRARHEHLGIRICRDAFKTRYLNSRDGNLEVAEFSRLRFTELRDIGGCFWICFGDLGS